MKFVRAGMSVGYNIIRPARLVLVLNPPRDHLSSIIYYPTALFLFFIHL